MKMNKILIALAGIINLLQGLQLAKTESIVQADKNQKLVSEVMRDIKIRVAKECGYVTGGKV